MSSAQGVRQLGRMLPALKALAGGLACDAPTLSKALDWPLKAARKTCENLRAARLAEFTNEIVNGVRQMRLTPEGMDRIGQLDPLSIEAALTVEAMELIMDTPAGMDSQVLAQELGVQPEAVHRALQAHVAAQRLVACNVTKVVDGRAQHLLHYRESGGLGPRRDYSLRPDEPGALGPMFPAQAASPAKRAAPARVPFVGTLDIDAIHTNAAAREGRPDPAGSFSCALWSNAHLVIRSGGQELRLTPEHTKALVAYLGPMIEAERLAEREAQAA